MFRRRVRDALLAFQGKDVCPDHGMQRIGPDGRVQTLAKIPMAMWVETDDLDVAAGMLGKAMERQFGQIDWDDQPETKHHRSTVGAIRRLEA